MGNKIDKLFESRIGLLTFSILSGLGYFSFILSVIIKFSRGGSPLIGFFFAPAIICGVALFLVKTIKNNVEGEAYSKNHRLFFFHIAVMVIGVIFFLDMIV